MQWRRARTGGLARVFLVVAAVHVAVVLLVGHFRRPALYENGALAQNIVAGRGFSIPMFPSADPLAGGTELRRGDSGLSAGVGDPLPSSNQPPGYPFLLVLTWKTLGDGPAGYAALSLIQALLISTTVWPVAWLTSRWYGATAARWAAWIVGLFPMYLWAATRLHHYPLAVVFHPWVVAGWLQLRERPSTRLATAVGALTGVGALFQPFLLGVAGLLGLWSLWSAVRARAHTAVRCLLVAAAVTLLVILPWVVRGYRVHHQFVPLKNSFAKEFWIGNNPIATGTDVDQNGSPLFSRLVLEHPELRASRTEAELMSRMQVLALEEIRRDPRGFLARSLHRVVWFWSVVPPRYLPRAGLLRHVLGFQALCWFALVGLALATLLRGRRRPSEYVGVLGIYVLVYSVVYGITFVTHSRFRGELEYIFIPAAACSLVGLWRTCKPKAREQGTAFKDTRGTAA